MSGGVDSSAVAALLVREGASCRRADHAALEPAAACRNWSAASAAGQRCCSLDDVYDAKRVAQHLGMPHYVREFRAALRGHRGAPVRRGVSCRPHADSLHAVQQPRQIRPLLVTAEANRRGRASPPGHYARIRFDEATGRYHLLRAVDDSKDQTYFLFGLTQEQLARTACSRSENCPSRRCAKSRAACNLPVAEKAESQEICFVPVGRLRALHRSLPRGKRRGGASASVSALARDTTRAASWSSASGEVLGGTTACTISPWASAAAWASPPRARCTFSKSIRPRGASPWAMTANCAATPAKCAT